MTPVPGQLESIRAMRGIAALAVALSHLQPFVAASAPDAAGFPFAAGKAGVDVFFVISGFVMAIATANLPAGTHSSLGFLWRRLARIAPLYWLVTLSLVAAIACGWNLGAQRTVDWHRVILSLLFIPVHSLEGGIRPIIAVGWSLDYEMYFYLCMAAVLCAFPRHRLLATAGLMGAIYLFGRSSLGTDVDWVVNAGLALEFLFGFVAASSFRDTRRACLLLALGLTVCLALQPQFEGLHPYGAGFDRALTWGTLAFVLILGVATLDHLYPLGPLPALGRLGDASYALYLTHVPTFAVVQRVLGRLDLPGGLPMSLSVMLASAVLVSLLVHRWIERPMTDWLQAKAPGRHRRS